MPIRNREKGDRKKIEKKRTGAIRILQIIVDNPKNMFKQKIMNIAKILVKNS